MIHYTLHHRIITLTFVQHYTFIYFSTLNIHKVKLGYIYFLFLGQSLAHGLPQQMPFMITDQVELD